MGERKELGRIQSATYGMGGYQDAQFGLSLTFEGKGWGVGTFNGGWADPPTAHAQWTEVDRMNDYAATALIVLETIRKAKVRHVAQLAGVPVEITFEGNVLKSWRVLEEVL